MEIDYLSDAEIRQLDRDLRILIATNGTLTRILEIISNEEIAIEIIEQQNHVSKQQGMLPSTSTLSGGTIRRRVALVGRYSRTPFVAAESMMVADRLPHSVRRTLAETDRPIGEVILSGSLETFKDVARVWVSDVPEWLPKTFALPGLQKVIARQYRMITRGKPVMAITEYFLINSANNSDLARGKIA